MRHHRLLELYLMEALGLSWDEVHTEAERLEHSPLGGARGTHRRRARISRRATRTAIPIPTAELVLEPMSACSLCDVAAGDQAVVRRVPDSDPELLRYLAEPRAGARASELVVVEQAPFEGR